MVNLFAGLIAYTYLPQKPALDLEPKGDCLLYLLLFSNSVELTFISNIYINLAFLEH